MKKKMLRSLISVFIILASGPLYAAVVDKIVVVVNNEVITQGEIDRQLAPIFMQYRNIYKGNELIKKLEEAKQNIVGQLLEERLMLSEAKKLNIEVTEKEVDAKIMEIQKRFGSEDEFEWALAGQHVAMKDLRARYKDQIMTKKLIDQKVGAKVMITPAEVSEYYEKHASSFTQPEEIRLRNILVRPKPEMNPKKTEELVREIGKRIKEGGDFGELAKIYSDGPGAAEGGLMTGVKRGDLLPQIEEVVFKMKTGECSDAIQTAVGYHFFKIEEKKEPKSLTLSEARQQIEEAIFREKIKVKGRGWLDSLKKSAYIAFK